MHHFSVLPSHDKNSQSKIKTILKVKYNIPIFVYFSIKFKQLPLPKRDSVIFKPIKIPSWDVKRNRFTYSVHSAYYIYTNISQLLCPFKPDFLSEKLG